MDSPAERRMRMIVDDDNELVKRAKSSTKRVWRQNNTKLDKMDSWARKSPQTSTNGPRGDSKNWDFESSRLDVCS